MTQLSSAGLVTADPFTAFAALRRGDAAPDWLMHAVAKGWGLNPARITAHLIAVSENATFRLDLDGAPYAVLRVHRPAYVDPHQIACELIWVQALAAETEVAVPKVLPLADGSLVLAVHDDAGASPSDEEPWYVVAFAFVDGEVLEDMSDPRPYYRQIGEITAQFHEQSERWHRPEGFDRLTWNLEDMLGVNSRWGDWRHADLTPEQRQIMEEAEAQARSDVAPLVAAPEGRGLIHADLRPSNIMSTQGSLTVIDFDDCGQGWFLYDFASAFSFIEHEAYTPSIAQDWLAGYTSVRPLSETQVRYACALSMIRRLQMVGWTTTHRPDALPAEIWDAQLPGSAEVARRYLNSPTWLLD
ncbi:phosphotransferase enzyme family protein [Nesterenkonia flava]|uniref:Phosphotransferase n=1 Tax=Nesterenkonia flava TaxID=469799 RepID=A0ABU1FVS9_9MICC|nr:phosphotransferase [Nesterenkonia flava]MDR5712256.1 phosphotransferase [Nesterenkonia flava]